MSTILNTIEEALIDLQNGKFVIVVDDEGRENEGDLICAASKMTPAMANFAITKAKGLMCVSVTKEKAKKLNLYPMTANNTDIKGTNFTISIDFKDKGCTTGISAYDRAVTINALLDPETTSDSFTRPGHVFPLVADENGVLGRDGHTEASLDLSRLAGLGDAAVLIEIIKPNGEMARLPDLKVMATEWNMKIISIADLIKFRQKNPAFPIEKNQTNLYQNPTENYIKTPVINLPTASGNFKMVVYKDLNMSEEFTVIFKDDEPLEEGKTLKVRLHSSCLTGDIFGSRRCDCGDQLKIALDYIEREGNGMVIYLPQEGRGIGLFNKIKAYQLQDQGLDTIEANLALGFEGDMRNYDFASIILKDMGIKEIQLMTNNSDKIVQLENNGITVIGRTPVIAPVNRHNAKYLKTKQDKMQHNYNIA
jgi:3,4-dihydroxy 2-butanone 4-phosphate synthase / GTP cyclohydrolase II